MQAGLPTMIVAWGILAVTGTGIGRAEAPAREIPMKGSAAAVKALLVVELAGGEMAGFSQALTATTLATGDKASLAYRFNQPVGDDMRRALDAAVRGLQIRHKGWPRGQSVEFTFKEKYSPKDGPSAATACALILDALILGHPIDPDFAVTGDMNSDLSVQAVGGVPSKIRGAIKGGCKLIAVPAANRQEVEDMVVLDGYKALGQAQIFSIASFDEAKSIGLATKPEDVMQSINDYAKLQTGEIKLASPEGKALLAEIVKRTPNHLSADLILRKATGSAPSKLSLLGSIETVERTSAPFFAALREGKGKEETINGPDFEQAMTTLSRLNGKLNAKVVPYYLATMDFLAFARRVVDKKVTNRNEYFRFREDLLKRLGRVDAEWKKLTADPQVVEAMNR